MARDLHAGDLIEYIGKCTLCAKPKWFTGKGKTVNEAEKELDRLIDEHQRNAHGSNL